jgi:ribonuclease VapC
MANEVVLDASALIAFLAEERGGERVRARIQGAAITTVNLVEVADYAFRTGGSRTDLDIMLRELPLLIVPFDRELALDSAALLEPTRAAGLSLADRSCLALARRLSRSAMTADRVWSRIAEAVEVGIELIR